MLKIKFQFFYLGIILNLSNRTFGNPFKTDFYIMKQTKYDDLSEVSQAVENLNELKNAIGNLRRDLIETQEKCTTVSEVQPFPNRTCQLHDIPTNCDEATACTRLSGYYGIKSHLYNSTPFVVECDMEIDDGSGGWMIIQRRQDGSENFHRTWAEYKAGFGSIDGEFFIGLEKLHALTNFDGPQELLILLEKTDMIKAYAKYNAFVIGNESEKYLLKNVGKYEGTAGDSLTARHKGYKFSTKDDDNDNWDKNCAQEFVGGWWYNHCHDSNLNGHYGDIVYGKGINWKSFTGYTNSLKSVKMMIRRRRY